MKSPNLSVALLLLALTVHSRILVGEDTQGKGNDEVDRSARSHLLGKEDQLLQKLRKRLEVNGEDPNSVELKINGHKGGNHVPTKKHQHHKGQNGFTSPPPIPPRPDPRNFVRKNVQSHAGHQAGGNQNLRFSKQTKSPFNQEVRPLNGPFTHDPNANVTQIPTVQDIENGTQILRFMQNATKQMQKQQRDINHLQQNHKHWQSTNGLNTIMGKAYNLSVKAGRYQGDVQRKINRTAFSSKQYANYVCHQGNEFWLRCQDMRDEMRKLIQRCLRQIKILESRKQREKSFRGKGFSISDPTGGQHIGGFHMPENKRRELKSDGGSPSPHPVNSFAFGETGKGGKDETDFNLLEDPFDQHPGTNGKSRKTKKLPSVSFF